MPTYEYQCDACEHTFEEFQSMMAEPLKKCPACGKKKLRRLFGPGAGIIFKGSGFYQTDYRSESYQAGAKADEPGKTSTTSTDSTSKGEAGGKTAKKDAKSASRDSDD
jgi:putative FmdB family regulatory protein